MKNQVGIKILDWYINNCRDLPWRKSHDAYKILVSEFMLQQTRVDSVINYYNRFIRQFDKIEKLAAADESEVLSLWQGLGYYTRARNLHKTAKIITHKYNRVVPFEYEELIKLPGIGDYIASSLSAIAYNQPNPVVDGNVLRVISRIFGLDDDISKLKTKNKFKQYVVDMMVVMHADEFAQAMMEMGALVCKSQNPECVSCPVNEYCHAYLNKCVESLPVRTKKKPPAIHDLYAYVIINKGNILLEHRVNKALLKNMWGLHVQNKEDAAFDLWLKTMNLSLDKKHTIGSAIHIFTHQKWQMEIILCDVNIIGDQPNDTRWISIKKLADIPIPVAFSKVINIVKSYINDKQLDSYESQ